jgi:hypothetical protein
LISVSVDFLIFELCEETLRFRKLAQTNKGIPTGTLCQQIKTAKALLQGLSANKGRQKRHFYRDPFANKGIQQRHSYKNLLSTKEDSKGTPTGVLCQQRKTAV